MVLVGGVSFIVFQNNPTKKITGKSWEELVYNVELGGIRIVKLIWKTINTPFIQIYNYLILTRCIKKL